MFEERSFEHTQDGKAITLLESTFACSSTITAEDGVELVELVTSTGDKLWFSVSEEVPRDLLDISLTSDHYTLCYKRSGSSYQFFFLRIGELLVPLHISKKAAKKSA